MDHFQQVLRQVKRYLVVVILLENCLLIGSWLALVHYTDLSLYPVAGIVLGIGLFMALLFGATASRAVSEPLRALWGVILHLSPSEKPVASPDVNQLRIGRDLVSNLARQIYQLTSVAQSAAVSARQESINLGHNFIANNLPLPFFVLDASNTITFANQSAAEYLGIATADLTGKNVYMVLDMSFPSPNTFDRWLKDVSQHSATASNTWERVRLNVRDTHPTRLFDLAAYYNKNNAQNIETMLTLFDHTKRYSQDEQAISFIALSVHELRTPMTMLRGYIEVFEDEISALDNPELTDFMQKMSATAQQLNAFINNILNVARVDDDQLELRLHEENWENVLGAAVKNLELRAKVRGIRLECSFAPGLPTVGVDRLSIYEVITNLVDNAIKYSGTSQVIKVESHLTTDGMVETTVQDYGVGIASNVMSNLFTKFYRDHRNRAQIGGTGLGLYLAKAIVSAHGGQVWVRSTEGQGSVFGFTVHPYSAVAAAAKAHGDQQIVRTAHGWIKNHSLYRR